MDINYRIRELAEELKKTPEYENLISARTRVTLDPRADGILRKLQSSYMELERCQLTGEDPPQSSVYGYQMLQQQAQRDQALVQLHEAEEKFERVMENVNNILAEELFDF